MNRVMNGVMNKETEKKRKVPLYPLKEKNKKKKNKDFPDPDLILRTRTRTRGVRVRVRSGQVMVRNACAFFGSGQEVSR